MKIPSKELSFIKKMEVARVATVDSEGMPHVVPVCPILDGAKIYFASETKAKKMQNLKANPQLAMVFDAYHGSWRGLKGVMIQGEAKVVDRKTFNRIRAKLYKKYPKYDSSAALEYGESSIIAITLSKTLSWGF